MPCTSVTAASRAAVRPAVWAAAIATAAQAGHFTEELATGFHQRLPAAFDLPPMSLGLFVAFNLAWLAIWALSAWGLARRSTLALFPLWFLGVASVANGLLHPLLALREGAYFPGLATSPLMAAVGALLLARLARVTA
ncbi:MAG: HXXEE domain-containing protein [bacterium]|nr:HXXEE domain-containing protein [bacterium]